MNKNSLTKTQLFFIIVQSQVGYGLISMPYIVFQESKTDGWISVLLGGVILQAVVFIGWSLCKRFPSLTIFQISKNLMGKYVGNIINILYVIYFTLTCCILLSLFSITIKDWILPYTPGWIIKLLIISVAVYVAKEKITVIARYLVLTTVVLFLFIILPAYSLKDSEILYLLPIGQSGLKAIFKGGKEIYILLQGFEIFMIILPVVSASAKVKLKIISLACLVVTLLYTFLTIVCLMFFSPEEFPLIPEPILYLVKSFEFNVIERPDIIFIALWIALVSTTIMTFLYSSSKGSTSFTKYERSNLVYISGVMIFIISLFFNSKNEIEKFSMFVGNSGIIFTIGIPLILLVISLVRKRQENIN